MSDRKKNWVKSVFGQLSSSQSLTCESPAKRPCLQRSTSFSDASASAKTKLAVKKNVFSSTNDNWIDSFAPTNSEELAIHPKKITELQDWLRHCDAVYHEYPAQFCLLTGPSGAGKTAAIRVLSEEARLQLREYINPVDAEVVTQFDDKFSEHRYVSRLQAFETFLRSASRYKSLMDRFNRRLLLVEDFPNALINDAATFETILDDYLEYGKSPLIFIVADSKSRGLNMSYNLFSDQIKAKFRVQHISFNAVAATLMQKAMKRFCMLMQQQLVDTYKVPAQSVVDSIVVGAQGDIRNALINLHFASLKGAPSILTKPLEIDKKKSKKKQSTLKSIGRDESITMLHALGRVFNPKFDESKKLSHSPEEIAESFSTEPKKFTDFVHANYLPHFSEIEHLVAAANGLSLADVILSEYREDALASTGLNIAVRSVMVANAKPVSGWMPVRGIKRLNIVNQPSINDVKQFGLSASISTSLYVTEYSSYVKSIQSNKLESIQVT